MPRKAQVGDTQRGAHTIFRHINGSFNKNKNNNNSNNVKKGLLYEKIVLLLSNTPLDHLFNNVRQCLQLR